MHKLLSFLTNLSYLFTKQDSVLLNINTIFIIWPIVPSSAVFKMSALVPSSNITVFPVLQCKLIQDKVEFRNSSYTMPLHLCTAILKP